MKAAILIALSAIFGLACIYLIVISLYMRSVKRKKLLYDIDYNKDINIIKDIEYKKVGIKSLLLDIYQPKNIGTEGNQPAVIFIHGEGPESFIKDAKDWGLYTSYGRLLAEKGFVGITFNHRPAGISSGFKNIDEAAKDILDLVDFIRKNAEKWNIDENRICLWGFSAGALYLSLFLKNLPGYVKSIVSYYGVLDIKAFAKSDEESLKAYSPENYLSSDSEKAVPLLIVKAAKDRKQINQSIDDFLEAAKLNQIKYDYIVHSSGRHAFDALDDNDETREVIEETLEFITKNI